MTYLINEKIIANLLYPEVKNISIFGENDCLLRDTYPYFFQNTNHISNKKLLNKILENLEELSFVSAQITHIVGCVNLKKITCDYSYLSKLPSLQYLKILKCTNTHITELPELPNLEILTCDFTPITIIPKLPKLRYLTCTRTKIAELPELPELRYLDCSYTLILYLPNLLKLRILKMYECKIFYIPEKIKLKLFPLYNSNVIVSQKTIDRPENNKLYKTFVNCQKNYKKKIIRNRIHFIVIKLIHHPMYIAGYNNKQQLYKLLNC